ncbi:3'-5' exoribonuclease 1-like [Diadema antillarum]|uniref:3'-5' exoribonuclease 1-like n=1 Tax=Diadema antillarum TaxID=105358 RepID=UPI003A87A741
MLELEYFIAFFSLIFISCIVWLHFRSGMDADMPSIPGESKSRQSGARSPRRSNPRKSKLKRVSANRSRSPTLIQRGKDCCSTVKDKSHTAKRNNIEGDDQIAMMDVDETVQDQMEEDENDDQGHALVEMDSKKMKKGNEHESQRWKTVPSTSSAKVSSASPPKDFSHPVYKKMSLKNGLINRMCTLELQRNLQELNLNNQGSANVLKGRLKNHYKKEALAEAGLSSEVPVHFDYLCVIDVEATCMEINPIDYIHEIIEFPVVLVNTRTRQIEDTFEAFCKPVINPKLSKFCQQLTHISQFMVDKAEEFPVVLQHTERWMKSKGLGSKHSFAIATDCSLDMDLYLQLQCKVSEISYPKYAREWINISKVFANVYKTKRVPLRTMLDNIGLAFAGQPHRGIDDARNIARIAMQLLEDGAELKLNEKLTPT